MLGKSLASIVRDLMLLSRGAKGVCKYMSVLYPGDCSGGVLPVDMRGVSGAAPAVTPLVPCCTLDYWVSTDSSDLVTLITETVRETHPRSLESHT